MKKLYIVSKTTARTSKPFEVLKVNKKSLRVVKENGEVITITFKRLDATSRNWYLG